MLHRGGETPDGLAGGVAQVLCDEGVSDGQFRPLLISTSRFACGRRHVEDGRPSEAYHV